MPKSMLRGTPIYATRGVEKIAIVPEIRLSRRRLGKHSSDRVRALTAINPSAFYLIDQKGVKRVSLEPMIQRQLLLVALSFLLPPALNLLARIRKKHV